MRLIDVQPVLDYSHNKNIRVCTVDLLEALPVVDAVPVVRGGGVVTDAYPHRVYCSLCYKTNVPNEEWLYEKNDYPKYCMWCGAKMGDKPCG